MECGEGEGRRTSAAGVEGGFGGRGDGVIGEGAASCWRRDSSIAS